MRGFIEHYLEDNRRILDSLDPDRIEEIIESIATAGAEGRRIFAIGNGGSASTASHFVVDLAKGASLGRDVRYKVIPLTDNVEWMTALANDVAYADVFVEQLRNFAEPGDVLLAISGSGNSENILRAVRYANEIGCTTVGLTGFEGGQLGPIVQHAIVVASDHMGRIEDAHLIVQHIICYALMERCQHA